MTRNKKTRNKKTNERTRCIQNKNKKNKMKTKYGGITHLKRSIEQMAPDANEFSEEVTQKTLTGLTKLGDKFVEQGKLINENVPTSVKTGTANAYSSTKNIISNLSGSQSKEEKEIQKLKAKIKDIQTKNPMNVTDIQKLEKEIEELQRKSKNDVSRGLRKFGEGVATFGQGLFSSKKSKFSNKEKDDIIKKLGELKTNKQLNQTEYDLLIEYLNQKSMTDSFGNTTQTLASSVFNSIFGQSDSKTTIPDVKTKITAAMIPNLYKKYNKIQVTELAELEEGEPIFFLEEYSDMGHKLTSNLNSVDNFLAKILNECLGPGCKNGKDVKFKVDENLVTDTRPIKNK